MGPSNKDPACVGSSCVSQFCLAIPPKNVHLTENPNHGLHLGLCDTAQDKGELEDGTVVNLALIQFGGNLL